MSFIESIDKTYIKIKETEVLNKGQLEFLSYLFRFGPCTTNELIDLIEKERPDLDRNSLDLFDRKPSELKLFNVIKVSGKRKCKSTKRTAQVLAVTGIIPQKIIKLNGKAKNILDGSMNSALLAVEIYNKPRSAFKSEAFIALMIMAWTKAFHAYFHSIIGDKYFETKDGKPVFVDKENTMKKYWGLQACINKYGKLKEEVRKNIEFFIPLRNKIEHAHLSSKEIDVAIFGECQALLINYESFLIDNFGSNFSINESLVFSLQFSRIRSKEQEQANKEIQIPAVKDLLNYIETYRKGLPPAILGSQDYRIKIQLVPVLSGTSSSDLPVEFVRLGPGESIDGKNLTAIIRDKIVEKEVVGKGTLIHTDVFNRVNEKLGHYILSSHSLNAFNYVFSIKPIKGEKKDLTETNRKYCEYHIKFKRYQYTSDYVDLLYDLLLKNKIKLDEVMENYKKRKKMNLIKFA